MTIHMVDGGRTVDENPKPYLLTAAAELTGLSVDAIRKRIRRRTLRGNKSNEDGQWRVWLTSMDVEALKAEATSGRQLDVQDEESRIIKGLESELDTVRDALIRERERADRVEVRAEEVERRLEAERARWAAEATRERDRAEGALIRAAAAEAEAKALRETLEEARRPFWRRLIG